MMVALLAPAHGEDWRSPPPVRLTMASAGHQVPGEVQGAHTHAIILKTIIAGVHDVSLAKNCRAPHPMLKTIKPSRTQTCDPPSQNAYFFVIFGPAYTM